MLNPLLILLNLVDTINSRLIKVYYPNKLYKPQNTIISCLSYKKYVHPDITLTMSVLLTYLLYHMRVYTCTHVNITLFHHS